MEIIDHKANPRKFHARVTMGLGNRNKRYGNKTASLGNASWNKTWGGGVSCLFVGCGNELRMMSISCGTGTFLVNGADRQM